MRVGVPRTGRAVLWRLTIRRDANHIQIRDIAAVDGSDVIGLMRIAGPIDLARRQRKPADRRSGTDRGLTRLELTKAGRTDPVARHLRGGPGAQWHSHIFELPDGAVDLARSLHGRRPHCDAFRIGRNVYGLQFHPEPEARALTRDGWVSASVDGQTAVAERVGRAVLRAWVNIAVRMK